MRPIIVIISPARLVIRARRTTDTMSLFTAILFVLAGFVCLALGGEVLVRGAITASRLMRVPPVVIGLTVVALATSLPELAVSLIAAIKGSPDVAVGNVVGSNIFNIGAIIGIAAILFPSIQYRSPKLRLDLSFMVAAALILVFTRWESVIGRPHGVALFAVLVTFLWIRIRSARRGEYEEDVAEADIVGGLKAHALKRRGAMAAGMLILAGTGLLTGGAELLVRGAVRIAELAGVSERVIAVSLISAGTGLPEFATAIVAAIRRQAALAIGNVIGSNIFNVFGILGIVSAVHPPIPVASRIAGYDVLWMVGFSILAAHLLLTPRRARSRFLGAVILCGYIGYVLSLF